MVNMPILNEPEILNNLRLRYANLNIFTRIGPTLIIINPYQSIQLLDSSFSEDLIQKVSAPYILSSVERWR